MVINSLELNIQLIIPLLFSTQVFAAIGDNTEVQYRSEELFTYKSGMILDCSVFQRLTFLASNCCL